MAAFLAPDTPVPIAVPDGTALARGRAVFAASCAPCHGPWGEGLYLAPGARAPDIRGAGVAKVLRQVRGGGKVMPAFPAVALPDASLDELASYVHTELARPAGEPTHVGPPMLGPFLVGLLVWGALLAMCCALALLFGEARN